MVTVQPTQPTQRTARPNTVDMLIVHKAFRREFRVLPELVRTVAAGDVERAATVTHYATLFIGALHHHHCGEDELVWPLLLERAGPQAETVLRMEEQHARVGRLLNDVERLFPVWRRQAGAHTRDELAQALAELSPALVEHLADEETALLPLVEKHLTVAEWEAVGARGDEIITPKVMTLFLGSMLLEATPDERAFVFAKLPPPVRVFWRLAGNRLFERQFARFRGR